MPGAGSIYHLETGAFVGTIKDGDAAGLAAAKAACVAGGLIQMGPGTEGIVLGVGWGIIALARIDALGRMFLSRFNMTDGDDPTKVFSWIVSGVSPATTRTVTMPNWSGILLLPATPGNNGEFLQSIGGGGAPIWATVPVPTNVLLDGSRHTDTSFAAFVRGDLISRSAGGLWERRAVGVVNTVPVSDGTDWTWSANPFIQHGGLSHLRPFAVANCEWLLGAATITTATANGFAEVKVGDFVFQGVQTKPSTQGAVVTNINSTTSVDVDLTNTNSSTLASTFIFQPGDHYSDNLALDTSTGAGLMMTLGRGTYVGPTGGATGSTFQELRGPMRWLPHSSGNLVTDFRVQGSATGTAGNESGFGITRAGASPFCAYFYPGALTNTRMYAFPDISGEFTLGGNTQILTNKTLDTTNKIIMGNANTWTVFQTTGGGGDRLTFDFTGMASLRIAKWQDFSPDGHVDYTYVSRITAIDGTSATTTNLFTVPAGKSFIMTRAVVRCTASAPPATGPSFGIGVAAGEDDIVASAAHAAFVAANTFVLVLPKDPAVVATAAQVIKLGIDTGAAGGAMTLAVDLQGYLV